MLVDKISSELNLENINAWERVVLYRRTIKIDENMNPIETIEQSGKFSHGDIMESGSTLDMNQIRELETAHPAGFMLAVHVKKARTPTLINCVAFLCSEPKKPDHIGFYAEIVKTPDKLKYFGENNFVEELTA